MSQRNIRVNELIKREISEVLHTRFQSETVYITITRVNVAPDHRKAHAFFSVLGGPDRVKASTQWLRKNAKEIRFQMGKRIVLKFLPHLQFHYDPSIEEGEQIIGMLDDLEDFDDEEEEEEEHPTQ